MTKIKICGLTSPADVACVNAAKPDFCGFVIDFPKSRRSVSPRQVRTLVRDLDRAVLPVGVFVDAPMEEVAALLQEGTIAVAQLHGHESEAYLTALRRLAPGHTIWQAFQLYTSADGEQALASSADCLVLDSGQGSGKTFDWSLIPRTDRPFLLAGGLTPGSLDAAIRTVRPWGVDLSSGVETEGRKDPEKIAAAVAAVRKEESL